MGLVVPTSRVERRSGLAVRIDLSDAPRLARGYLRQRILDSWQCLDREARGLQPVQGKLDEKQDLPPVIRFRGRGLKMIRLRVDRAWVGHGHRRPPAYMPRDTPDGAGMATRWQIQRDEKGPSHAERKCPVLSRMGRPCHVRSAAKTTIGLVGQTPGTKA